MVRLFTFLISIFEFEQGSSFLSIPLWIKFIGRGIANLFSQIINLILKMAWVIIKFMLGVMEAFEYMINSFIGIDTSVQDMYDFVYNSENGIKLLDILSTSLKAMMALSIVFLIIFTIFAMIKQEYNNAFSGGKKGNDKKPLITGMFKKMLYIVLFPITMMFIITGVNSILTSFSRAMSGGEDVTIAAQVLSTSTYDSNKYRYYAQENKRIPIIIKAYDPNQYAPDENELLAEKIKSVAVQDVLKTTVSSMSSKNLLTFNESVQYKNNKLSNSVEYGQGEWYETFICTAEQYQIMADFIDYAQKHNLKYHIKPTDSEDIDWRYVDSAVFNASDVSLKINYRDANDMNGDGKKTDSYTVEFSTSFEVTSPISNAMETILALLGVDSKNEKYSENIFKTMERDENYVNVVNWANEKVLIKLSNDFDLDDPSNWTRMDQLIIYEYYHFSSNNTFGKYSIADLVKGVELEASLLVYREYYPVGNAYSEERKIPCVKINGSYYRIWQDPEDQKTDKYGNIYYELEDSLTEEDTLNFLNNDYSLIQEVGTETGKLKLSGNFKANDPTTWEYYDQIIVYEFYKDLTSNNKLYSYNFNQFKEGIEVPVYKITKRKFSDKTVADRVDDETGYYLEINGIYYEATKKTTGDTSDPDYGKWLLSDASIDYLIEATPFSDTYYYNYEINLDGVTNGDGEFNDIYGDKYGISTSLESSKKATNFIVDRDTTTRYVDFTPLDESDTNFLKYSDFSLMLSKNFDHNEVDTWTFKDYFIFYLYINYNQIAGRLGLESLKLTGVNGEIGTIELEGTSATKYVYKVKYGSHILTTADIYCEHCGRFYTEAQLVDSKCPTCDIRIDDQTGRTLDLCLYLDIDSIRNISNMLINNTLDSTYIKQHNYTDKGIGNTLFIDVDSNDLVVADTEVREFKLSEGFSQLYPNNWTVLDYILYSFSNEGVINEIPRDEAGIESYKYSAVVYKIFDGEVLKDIMYKFGSSTRGNEQYLSLENVKALKDANGDSLNYRDVDDFLELNFLDYVAKAKGMHSNEIISNQDGIIDNLYNDLIEYVYSTDKIMEEIVRQKAFHIGANEYDLYSSVLSYTYSNPSVKIDDLETWTLMDALIYVATGTVSPTYTAPVYRHLNKNYFIVGNYAVDITTSTSPFKGTLSSANKITSRNSTFDGSGTLEAYVTANCADYIFNEAYFNGKKVKKYSNEKFTYKNEDTAYTTFDVIYEYLMGTTIALDGTVSLDAFIEGENVYLKTTKSGVNKYILVSEAYNDYISVEKSGKFTLSSTAKIATKEPTSYVAFDNNLDTTTFNADNLHIKPLDALIYFDTGVIEKKSLNVYKYVNKDGNEKKYVYSGKGYIEIKDNNEVNIINSSLDNLTNSDHELLTSLYSTYYQQYYKTAVDNILSDAVVKNATFEYVRPVDGGGIPKDVTITRISPFALIFSKLGLIDLTLSRDTVTGRIVRTARKTYFYYEGTTATSNEVTKIYVDVTDIGTVGYKPGDETNLFLFDNNSSVYEMVLRYMLMSNSDGGTGYLNQNTYAAAFKTFDSELEPYFEGNYLAADAVNTTLLNTSGFTLTAATSWTNFNTLYYYLTNSSNISTMQNIYTDKDGYMYVKIQKNTDVTYVRVGKDGSYYTNTLFDYYTFASAAYQLEDASTGNYSPLGIIAYKQTALKNGTVQLITYSENFCPTCVRELSSGQVNEDKECTTCHTKIIPTQFYFVKNNYYDEFVCVYNLDNASLRNATSYDRYYYNFRGDTDADGHSIVKNWTIFDYLIAYINAYSKEYKVSQNIQIYGSNAYISVDGSDNGKFINLSKLGILSEDDVDDIYASVGYDKLSSRPSEYSGSYNPSAVEALYNEKYASLVKTSTQLDLANIHTYNPKGSNTTIKYIKSEEVTAFDIIYSKLKGVGFATNNSEIVLSTFVDITSGTKYILIEKDSTDYYVAIGEDLYFDSADPDMIELEVNLNPVFDYVSTGDFDVFDDDRKTSSPVPGIGDIDRVNFSSYFQINDYSTWMLSDFVIYYIFNESPEQFNIDGNLNSTKNFQELVNKGYSPAKNYKYFIEDEFGNSILKDVIWIGIGEKDDGIAVDRTLFTKYYAQQLANIKFLDKNSVDYKTYNYDKGIELSMDFGATQKFTTQSIKQFYTTKNTVLNANQFTYDSYYYYDLDSGKLTQTDNNLLSVNANLMSDIADGKATVADALNIAISDGFDISDPSTWTWLDYIIVYEFSRTNIRHNYFEGMAFENLRTKSYVPVFIEGSEIVIELNGRYYDLSVIKHDTAATDKLAQIRNSKELMNGTTVDDAVTLKADGDNGFDFKTLYQQFDYNVQKSEYSLDYSKTPNSILYEYADPTDPYADQIMYYMTLNTDIIDTYKVNIASLNTNGFHAFTNIVREVSWPQKLMNDLQVLYPDLNWATLIATDGWLDTLGEFTSAQASGEYVSEGNSANITAAGLVLSEFFVSVAKEMDPFASVHSYEYQPIFSESTIKALMLAMLGEEQYYDLSTQASVFIEMFNNMFLPVLEDIARERGISIVDGKVDNFYISVYKAYLATVLLGSDIGEYFYKIATRVYAQYTIFDSLAAASGDYAAYMDYINSLSDKNGEKVTSFMYSSFHELAVYENSFSGNKNPTFTYNFESSLAYFYGENFTYGKLSDYDLSGVQDKENNNSIVTARDVKTIMKKASNFNKLNKLIDDTYRDIYGKGGRVSDTNVSGIYCFMFDVYWSIHQVVQGKNQNDPVYLNYYREYIMGEVKRWQTVADETIDGTSSYIPDNSKYKMALNINKIFAMTSVVGLYLPDGKSIDVEEEGSLFDKINSALDSASITNVGVITDTFNNTTAYTEFKRAYNNVFGQGQIMNISDIMDASNEGNTDKWHQLVQMRDDLGILVEELNQVASMSGEGYVKGDSTRGYRAPRYDKERYTDAYNDLQSLYGYIDTYISNQIILDKITKSSITFTLAQFGKNYVTDGYTFSFENKSYTMKATASAERLAEYVYGGAFLVKYGVSPKYTNENYHGFVESYKVYDSNSGSTKTRLKVWTELRTFVSELANYTAKLYYLSNMNDLSKNISDGILLTDTIYQGNSDDGGTLVSKTLEQMIIEYLLTSEIEADTFLRLSFGDTVATLDALSCPNDEFKALAYYIEGNYAGDDGVVEKTGYGDYIIDIGEGDAAVRFTLTGANKKDYIKRYWDYVGSSAYNSNGYYNDGSNTGVDRLHLIFKKIISYLIVTEEAEESTSEKAINLDNITFKEFRKILMQALSDYQKNPTENDIQNSNRYITLFNLISSQFAYTYSYINDDGETIHVQAGTTVNPLFVSKVNPDTGAAINKNDSAKTAGRVSYIYENPSGIKEIRPLYGEFSIDIPTRDIILTLAGIENRPIEELVGLEYESLYDKGGNYDEEDGDTFIICSYDESEGKYYPILGRNTGWSVSNLGFDYIDKIGIDIKTSYYAPDGHYPIIAKGVIDASGYPTAIKQVDGKILFYRTNITTAQDVGESALGQTRSGGEVTTIGYTKYTTGFWSAIGNSDKVAMFTGNSSIDSMANSDFQVNFIQTTQQYSITNAEDFESISVLEEFSAFYTLESRQLFLFLLGFSVLLPMLFSASATVLRRILDLIFLVLMGPMAIASLSLGADQNPDGKSKIFDTWKTYMTQTLLHVFGYIIAFNVYSILMSTILKMDLVGQSTMDAIYRIGGLSQFVTENSINALLRYVYIIAAAAAIKTSADLLINIVTAGKVTNAFQTPMGGDVMADIKKMAEQLKDAFDAVKGIASGQAATMLKDFAMETAMKAVPGGALIGKAVNAGQNLISQQKGKALEKSAISNGVSPEVAKSMSKQFVDNEMKQRQAKREQRAANANQFSKTFGGDAMFKAQENGALTKRQQATKKEDAKAKKKAGKAAKGNKGSKGGSSKGGKKKGKK